MMNSLDEQQGGRHSKRAPTAEARWKIDKRYGLSTSGRDRKSLHQARVER
jgi:hypothetical protein